MNLEDWQIALAQSGHTRLWHKCRVGYIPCVKKAKSKKWECVYCKKVAPKVIQEIATLCLCLS